MSNREATFAAIQTARKNYIFGTDNPAGKRPLDVYRRNAASETIERCESFINSAAADESAIDEAIHMGMVKTVPSGRRYIQLG